MNCCWRAEYVEESSQLIYEILDSIFYVNVHFSHAFLILLSYVFGIAWLSYDLCQCGELDVLKFFWLLLLLFPYLLGSFVDLEYSLYQVPWV